MRKKNKVLGYSKKSFLKIADVNTRYYGKVYKELSNGRVIAWNWAAFLFGYLWLAYRKAYIESAFWFGITFLGGLIFIPYFIVAPGWAKPIMGFFFSGVLGAFGNFIYAMSLKHKIFNSQPISIGVSNFSVIVAFIIATIISSIYLNTKSLDAIKTYAKILNIRGLP